MRTEYRFVCALPNGLHARPASILAENAGRFRCSVSIMRETAGAPAADVRSVLSVVGLDVHLGDPCVLVTDGEDAAEALDALRDLIEHTLAEVDEEAETAACASAAPATRLPVMLRRLGVAHAGGRAVCGGSGIGVVVAAGGLALTEEAARAIAGDEDAEIAAARAAVSAVRDDLCKRARAASNETEAALLTAHRHIAEDPALWKAIVGAIGVGATAAQAVVAAAEDFAGRLRGAASAYVRDRALDVQDIAMQLIDELVPGGCESTKIDLGEDSVVFAETLTANQLLRMDRKRLKGLVLGAVGRTSHTVILARNFGIPCIIDVEEVRGIASPGERAVVDGDGGFVITPMPAAVERFYERERRARDRRLARLLPLVSQAARTADGQHLEVGANATDAEEVAAAVKMGADGVGLFRTEFLFLDREAAPDEEEQLAVYGGAVRAAAGRPVIFRTFDIGGDKPAPYLKVAEEENPFLGCRGLRLYERHAGLLDVQLRAILRAGAGAPEGSVKVMAPMVATPAEASWFRHRVRQVEAELAAAGVTHAAKVPVGIMIEVPSVALSIEALSEEVDFFSIGTNDLCQYWMAADRGNAAVADLCDPHHPSFLRLLRMIVHEARAHGRWIGVCGEMGGRVRDLPLLIGMGLDEISGSSRQVVRLKVAVSEADAARCRGLLDMACRCHGPAEVEALLDGSGWRAEGGSGRPVVDEGCILIGSDAESKESAIKEAVDLLMIAGRTDRPRDVEEAVWAREETYSTGLGYGFAVPHCKCEAVRAPTLAVVRLEEAVEWGSMDGLPVQMVLLLAVPTDESSGGGAAGHMKVFATLARRLMHEEFRDRLLGMTASSEIERFLSAELGLA